MERYLVLYIPQWDLETAGHNQVAVQLHADRVIQLSIAAARAGISVGMRSRTVQQLCPEVKIVTVDPRERAAAFVPIYEAAATVVPQLTLWWPGRISALADGPTRYYGSDETVVENLLEAVAQASGIEAQCGVADGIFAATLAARQATIVPAGESPSYVARLPLYALLDMYPSSQKDAPSLLCAQLETLGIHTVGQLQSLGEAALSSRFGAGGSELFQLSCGKNPFQQREFSAPTQAITAQIECATEVTSAPQARLYARHLGNQLATKLRQAGKVPRRLRVSAASTTGEPFTRSWSLLDSVTERELTGYVEALCAAAAGHLGGALTYLQAEANSLVGVSELAQPLWGENNATITQTAISLQNLVGEEQVRVPQIGSGYSYRERNLSVPWKRSRTETASSKIAAAPAPESAAAYAGALTAPYPLTLFTSPRPLELLDATGAIVDFSPDGCLNGEVARCRTEAWELAVQAWEGPWNILGRWWQGEGIISYLRLQLPDRQILAARDAKGWWLDAEY